MYPVLIFYILLLWSPGIGRYQKEKKPKGGAEERNQAENVLYFGGGRIPRGPIILQS